MKTLNKYITLILIIIFVNTSYSQNCKKNKQHRERMEAEKIAFITEKLDLSVKEAQQFWPVYNQFKTKKQNFRKEKRELMQKLKSSINTQKNSEIENLLDNLLNIDLQIEQQKIIFNNKYKKIIGVKKTALLYESEMEFRKSLLRTLRKGNCKK